MSEINKVKEYWDNRPCNVRHSPSKIGTLQYFNEVEARKYFIEPHIPKFAEFKKWQGKKILEIGCGIGTDSINFTRAGADLTVNELSEKSLEICKERFKIYNLKANFYNGNAEEISSFIPVEKYDLIYSFGAIHHTSHPEKVFEEIKKYCGPETEIRIMLYSKWSWKVLWIILVYGKGAFWKVSRLVPKYSEAQTVCPITHYYSFKDIRHLMKDFEIIDMRKEHIFSYKIEKYKNYQYEKVWYFRYLPKFLFHWLERHFGWHTLIVAKIKK